MKHTPQMQDQAKRCHLLTSIKTNKTVASAKAFLKAYPISLLKLLMDNGKNSRIHLVDGSRERQPSGNNKFDLLCHGLGIKLPADQAVKDLKNPCCVMRTFTTTSCRSQRSRSKYPCRR